MKISDIRRKQAKEKHRIELTDRINYLQHRDSDFVQMQEGDSYLEIEQKSEGLPPFPLVGIFTTRDYDCPYMHHAKSIGEIGLADTLYQLNPEIDEKMLDEHHFATLIRYERARSELEDLEEERLELLSVIDTNLKKDWAKILAQEIGFSEKGDYIENMLDKLKVDYASRKLGYEGCRTLEDIHHRFKNPRSGDNRQKVWEALGIARGDYIRAIYDRTPKKYELGRITALVESFDLVLRDDTVTVYPGNGSYYIHGGDTQRVPEGSQGEIIEERSDGYRVKLDMGKIWYVSHEEVRFVKMNPYNISDHVYKAIRSKDQDDIMAAFEEERLAPLYQNLGHLDAREEQLRCFIEEVENIDS